MPAPVESRGQQAQPIDVETDRVAEGRAGRRAIPASYVVQRGDSLHAIAWRFRLDYRDLVRWNRLSNPDLIFPGQRLRLRGGAEQATAASSARNDAAPSSVLKQPSPTMTAIHWCWPAAGEIRPATSALGTKGIEIFGKRRQRIDAAADGEVVYSGSGLRGYGQLIIVRHDAEFLSAYAHNERILVGEGSHVTAGQQIAEMGDSGAKRVMLHFEVRRNGVTVDPLRFLPQKDMARN
jgi:lipoprotein NlpD